MSGRYSLLRLRLALLLLAFAAAAAGSLLALRFELLHEGLVLLRVAAGLIVAAIAVSFGLVGARRRPPFDPRAHRGESDE